jgi:hypothetical protein
MNDRDLDRELQRALDVEPSSDFAGQVQARIAAHRASRRRRRMVGASSLAAAVVVLAVWGVKKDRQGPPVAPGLRRPADVALAPASSPAHSMLATDVAAPVADARPAALTRRRAPLPRHDAVIVPASQQRGLRRLVALSGDADAALGSLLRPAWQDSAGVDDIAVPDGIVIAPIAIEPLDGTTY